MRLEYFSLLVLLSKLFFPKKSLRGVSLIARSDKPGSVACRNRPVVIYLALRLLIESSGERPSADHGI